MFKSKTVFVLGAGASEEAGLPVGSELKKRISEKLYITFDVWTQKAGDRLIVNAIMAYAQQFGLQASEFLRECRVISRAIIQAISVDNLLEAHQGNDKLVFCGKLAIARAILEAEGKSKLKFDELKSEGFSPSNLQGTWYENLFMLLTENVRANSLDEIFGNVSFVIFNYDRCLEHFLYHSLQNYYQIDNSTATQLIDGIRITHPYGAVGKLPWQSKGNAEIGFGAEPHEKQLLEIATQIKTFTEQVEDHAARDAMRSQIQDADTIVFLGFAFHPMNMQLITPENTSSSRRAFATGIGISNADLTVVRNDITEALRHGPDKPSIEIHVGNNLKSAGLLAEYWRTLSRR